MSAGRQVAYWLVGALALVLLLFLLRSVLLPFVAGMAVAYFLDPVVDRLERWKMSRTFATSVVTVLFFAILTVALILVVPIVQSQTVGFIERLPGYVEKVREVFLPLLRQGLDMDPGEDVGSAVAGAAFEAVDIVGQVLRGLWSGGLALINLLSLIFITPVVAFYLLRDWDEIVAAVDGWLPRRQAPVIRELMTGIDRVLSAFVRGTGSVCGTLALFYAVALTLLGLDFGFVVGLGAGLLSFIPFVGSLVGLVVAGALALVQFWPEYTDILLVLAVFAVGQVVEGNFLTPKFVGDKVGLHPVWVIFALLAGGALFGFLGILIAVPAAAAAGVLVRFAIQRYTASSVYLGPPEA
jgi:predicted PurR-regulated permease PerM